jgi:hypothetical protein
MVEESYNVKTYSYPPVLGEKFLRVKLAGEDVNLEKVSSMFEKLLLESGLFFEKVIS